eukprot:scaffold179427_cov33-Attheya_sp.AAC.1
MVQVTYHGKNYLREFPEADISVPTTDASTAVINTGTWSPEEHERFLRGQEQFQDTWPKIASLVQTRTSVQVMGHAHGLKQLLKRQTKNASLVQTRTSVQVMGHAQGLKQSLKRPAPLEKEWSTEEDDILLNYQQNSFLKYREEGGTSSNYAELSKLLPGRSITAVLRHWKHKRQKHELPLSQKRLGSNTTTKYYIINTISRDERKLLVKDCLSSLLKTLKQQEFRFLFKLPTWAWCDPQQILKDGLCRYNGMSGGAPTLLHITNVHPQDMIFWKGIQKNRSPHIHPGSYINKKNGYKFTTYAYATHSLLMLLLFAELNHDRAWLSLFVKLYIFEVSSEYFTTCGVGMGGLGTQHYFRSNMLSIEVLRCYELIRDGNMTSLNEIPLNDTMCENTMDVDGVVFEQDIDDEGHQDDEVTQDDVLDLSEVCEEGHQDDEVTQDDVLDLSEVCEEGHQDDEVTQDDVLDCIENMWRHMEINHVNQQNLEGTLISGHLFLKGGHRDSSVFAQADVPDHSGGIDIKMPIHTFLPQIVEVV